mmetsp:Transcript_20904/g.57971  ORF Transcript_20904/g.57971 Transcript_20904/m.57971 type:complete len:211 (-) Transcript_20904:258-890(-)|eukprot:CAMPEP_0117668724 /NCGR_PEP_ID=MMETSP0804-20121206/11715_1 /TAXON_ID=1074897 /ORGANISM="Tetraselmis astigmatica, Strain CCMP880" /LENGTH=210 /DNA_ID=CAMNT_0005476661 /DNA_START=262 /DNA_END=897 /DNA_ORIENTATION=-
MGEEPKGYMIVNVEEAKPKNKAGEVMWDGEEFECFVKVEIRGGSQKIKLATSPKLYKNAGSLYWNQELILEVLEGANELRLILCRKSKPTPSVSPVIAACGIYMSDILDAVPIDKYFELFKPGLGGEGGQIRVSMNYSPGSKRPASSASKQASGQSGSRDVSDLAKRHLQAMDEEDEEDDAGPRKPLIIGGAIAGAAVIAGVLIGILKKK